MHARPPPAEMGRRLHFAGVSAADFDLLFATVGIQAPCSVTEFYRVLTPAAKELYDLSEAGYAHNLKVLNATVDVLSA